MDLNRVLELDQSDDLWQEKLWAILDHVPRDRSGCIEMAELVWVCSLEEVWWTLFFDFWGFLTADERHYYIAEGITRFGKPTVQEWLQETNTYEGGPDRRIFYAPSVEDRESMRPARFCPILDGGERVIRFWMWCYDTFDCWRSNDFVWHFLLALCYEKLSPDIRQRLECEARERFGSKRVDSWIVPFDWP